VIINLRYFTRLHVAGEGGTVSDNVILEQSNAVVVQTGMYVAGVQAKGLPAA